MSRRPKFVAVSPPSKHLLASKRSRSKSPLFAVIHKSFGEGKLVCLRLSPSGSWLADIRFASGERRTVLLLQQFFIESVGDILALAPSFPQPKPTGEKEERIAATEEIDEDREPELALRIADHALQCGLKVRISSEEARNAVKRMI
jgi:hypothetical protein